MATAPQGESFGQSVVVANAVGTAAPPKESTAQANGVGTMEVQAVAVEPGKDLVFAFPVGTSSVVANVVGMIYVPPAATRFMGGAEVQLFRKETSEWIDISCEVTSARAIWGTDNPAGVLSVARGGSVEVEIYDPERLLDPSNLSSPYADILHPGTVCRLAYRASNGIAIGILTASIDTFSHTLNTHVGRIRGNDIASRLLKTQMGVYDNHPPMGTLHQTARDILAAAYVTDVTVEDDPIIPIQVGTYRNTPTPVNVSVWQAIIDICNDALCYGWIDSQDVLHFRSLTRVPSVPPLRFTNDGFWPIELGLSSSPDELINYIVCYSSQTPAAPSLLQVGQTGEYTYQAQYAPPASDGGFPIIDYELRYSVLSGAGWSESEFSRSWPAGTPSPVPNCPGPYYLSASTWYLAARNEHGVGNSGLYVYGMATPPPPLLLREGPAPTGEGEPVIRWNQESLDKYGEKSLSRTNRELPPGTAEEWADAVLRDRMVPPVIYTPIRLWPKSEAELMALIAIEGGQEAYYELDAVTPTVQMVCRVVGVNIQVDPEGWAAEIITYVPGQTFLDMVKFERMKEVVSHLQDGG